MMFQKTAFAIGTIALAACSSQPETTSRSSVDEVPAAGAFADALKPSLLPTPERATTPMSQSELERRGNELVRRDMAKRFSVWVMKVDHAVWQVDVSAEKRRQYAATQNNPSVALLAYEAESFHYSNWRALAIQATECGIRSRDWAFSFASKLRDAERRDTSLVAISEALSPIERETGDAFAAFLIDFNIERSVGKDPVRNCQFLASMPFLKTIDRFEAGIIDQIPRPPS